MPKYFNREKIIKDKLLSRLIQTEGIEVTDTVLKRSSVSPIFKRKKIDIKFERKLNSKDFYFICKQLHISSQSGLDILRTIELLIEQSEGRLRNVFEDVYSNVQTGLPLSKAFEDTKKFPYFFINMIRVGELSGNLEEIFSMLSDYYYKQYSLSNKIKQATAYPKLVFVLTITIMMALFNKIIPMFSDILYQFNKQEVPLPTQIVIKTSYFIREYQIAILSFLILLFLILKINKRIDSANKAKEYISINLPIIKKINVLNTSVQFTAILAMLTNGGIPIGRSIEILTNVVENRFIKEKFKRVALGVQMGVSLSESLSQVEFFPKMLINILRTSEETGTLDKTLKNMSEYYYLELDEYIKRVMVFVEPTLIILVAVLIGFIVMALMLPIFKIYRSII
ncbi:type II secretion system F family protein [Caloramator proteoclasticus]|uniref:Type IV pilus assembly protein PilC n=1 Tax=Caloramator proteoclasticus DSM 10124 TaxID=1121262 RepID=A0A1M4YAS7_9CLOT|nr:type II secretion system F family protein [Caloramator proteoclasticus]SHF02582.1 type IV pilus assembly protein PilC [Caloramator proteoclasticus DSM 10124]